VQKVILAGQAAYLYMLSRSFVKLLLSCRSAVGLGRGGEVVWYCVFYVVAGTTEPRSSTAASDTRTMIVPAPAVRPKPRSEEWRGFDAVEASAVPAAHRTGLERVRSLCDEGVTYTDELRAANPPTQRSRKADTCCVVVTWVTAIFPLRWASSTIAAVSAGDIVGDGWPRAAPSSIKNLM
jgi:hypothetical protein